MLAIFATNDGVSWKYRRILEIFCNGINNRRVIC